MGEALQPWGYHAPQVYPTGGSGHITHLPGPAWLSLLSSGFRTAPLRSLLETEHQPKCKTHNGNSSSATLRPKALVQRGTRLGVGGALTAAPANAPSLRLEQTYGFCVSSLIKQQRLV